MSEEDKQSVQEDPRVLKFFTPGSRARIEGTTYPYIDLQCKGDILMVHVDVLRKDWKPAHPDTCVDIPFSQVPRMAGYRIDVRSLKVGAKLRDIPLVRCPVCKKTAFTLDSVGRDYCHMVENLTNTSGDVLMYCTNEK